MMQLEKPIKKISVFTSKLSFMPLTLTLAIFLVVMVACTAPANATPQGQNLSTVEFKTMEGQVDTKITPQAKQSRDSNECPALDSQLYQLSRMEDAPGKADQLDLRVKGNKVQVLIILENEDSAFLLDYDTEVGTQSGKQVQAYVPFDQLCKLANDKSVLAIRPAAQAIQ